MLQKPELLSHLIARITSIAGLGSKDGFSVCSHFCKGIRHCLMMLRGEMLSNVKIASNERQLIVVKRAYLPAVVEVNLCQLCFEICQRDNKAGHLISNLSVENPQRIDNTFSLECSCSEGEFTLITLALGFDSTTVLNLASITWR